MVTFIAIYEAKSLAMTAYLVMSAAQFEQQGERLQLPHAMSRPSYR